MRDLLPMLLLLALWGIGGWLIALRAFRLRTAEQTVVGFALGMFLSAFFSNLTLRLLPAPTGLWAAAGPTLLLGVLLWQPWKRENLRLRLTVNWPLWIVLLVLTYVFYLIGRGLALFDDYQNLTTLSLLAAGDLPLHFSLDPGVRIAYHYLLLLVADHFIWLGGMSVWSALDLARALTIALTFVLAGLWTFRLTRSRIIATLGALFFALSGGTRWLLLFLPGRLLHRIAAHVTLVGSGADTAADLVTALQSPWDALGSGPIGFPFAYVNGVVYPYVIAHNGFSLSAVLIVLLLLLTASRWNVRPGAALTSVALIAALALANEVTLGLLILGALIAIIAWVIRHRSLRLPRQAWTWIGLTVAGGLIALAQGGVLTEALYGWLFPQAETPTYFKFAFRLIWPPELYSSHLGPLRLTDPYQLPVALAELGPLVLVTPFLLAWGWKRLRRNRWVEAAFGAMTLTGFVVFFVGYAGTGSPSAMVRFIEGLILPARLMAVPLIWFWARRRAEWIRLTVLGLGLISILSGVILFGASSLAATRPVYSFFLTNLDAAAARDHWNRLEPGTLIFDPDPYRAPVVFGRFTDARVDWFEPKPAWLALYDDPDPARLNAAGFAYVYLDAAYWDRLSLPQRERFDAPCVRLLAEYTGPISATDFRSDFRRLYDIRACR